MTICFFVLQRKEKIAFVTPDEGQRHRHNFKITRIRQVRDADVTRWHSLNLC